MVWWWWIPLYKAEDTKQIPDKWSRYAKDDPSMSSKLTWQWKVHFFYVQVGKYIFKWSMFVYWNVSIKLQARYGFCTCSSNIGLTLNITTP